MASRYKLFDECNLMFLLVVRIRYYATGDRVFRHCGVRFFPYDSFQRQLKLTISPSSDWNELRDIIKYKIEQVVYSPIRLKFRVLIHFSLEHFTFSVNN